MNTNPNTKPTIQIFDDITSEPAPAVSAVPDVSTVSDTPVSAASNVSTVPVQESVSPPLPLPPPYTPSIPRRKKITRTLKYKLGKHANGKVSVLIKNAQTRRKIQTKQAMLKRKSILDIKNHLRSKNLLKVGSQAPNDVLREIYEQSILAGQIENKSKETLIHNYFNDK
jgi:hypothetical protein